ncbi:MAG: hypothetical protein Q7K26_04430 [bacterium]|nr:hypothetical protein [bacterium]
MEAVPIFACSEFWKDVKRLRKTVRPDFLECPFGEEEFEKLSCIQKMECIPLLRHISTTIRNKINKLEEIPNNHKNATYQPFLSMNFILWKLRWGVDNHGPAYGLRIMYCIQDKNIVFANIKHKKEVKDSENAFQGETIERLKFFFSYEYK